MFGIEHLHLLSPPKLQRRRVAKEFTSMPPVSEAQRRLMHAAAKDPKVARKTGVPTSVAKEFAKADKPGKLPAKSPKKRS